MSFEIGSNFELNSRLYLDVRQVEDSFEVLQANPKGYLYPPGFEVYCKAEGKWYQNTAQEGETFSWTERQTGNKNSTSIDDNNIRQDATYSSYNIENKLTLADAKTTQVADDLLDIDTRVIYLEGKQLIINSFDGTYNSLRGKPVDLATNNSVDTKILEVKELFKEKIVTNNTVNGSNLILSKEKHQVTSMVSGTTIVLPSVTEYTEIHLYFEAINDINVKIPSSVNLKYGVIPGMSEGSYYEMIFTYTDRWLLECVSYSA